MKIYLAGPLFSEAERDWMRKVKKELEELAEFQDKQLNVIWPYELLTQ
jgi:nucleoside 2-deoxyribosyltransferase